jgi:hypothetical protein
MGDFAKILVTSIFTAAGAVFVFAVTQLFGKLVIEAMQDFRKTLGEIRYALVFHAQAIFTPVGDIADEAEASKAFRRLSCELRSKVESIPLYEFWSRWSGHFLPSKKGVSQAASHLLGLSNSVQGSSRPPTNSALVAKIESLLEFEPLEGTRSAI